MNQRLCGCGLLPPPILNHPGGVAQSTDLRLYNKLPATRTLQCGLLHEQSTKALVNRAAWVARDRIQLHQWAKPLQRGGPQRKKHRRAYHRIQRTYPLPDYTGLYAKCERESWNGQVAMPKTGITPRAPRGSNYKLEKRPRSLPLTASSCWGS